LPMRSGTRMRIEAGSSCLSPDPAVAVAVVAGLGGAAWSIVVGEGQGFG